MTEVRECYVEVFIDEAKKAIFHKWTDYGFGVVEFEDGSCGTYEAFKITFITPINKITTRDD